MYSRPVPPFVFGSETKVLLSPLFLEAFWFPTGAPRFPISIARLYSIGSSGFMRLATAAAHALRRAGPHQAAPRVNAHPEAALRRCAPAQKRRFIVNLGFQKAQSALFDQPGLSARWTVAMPQR
jgi:hypothetical protein